MIETDNSRVVVVSNRLPYTLRRAGDTWKTEKSAGGLATAMGPVLNKTGGLWVGWPRGTAPTPATRSDGAYWRAGPSGSVTSP